MDTERLETRRAERTSGGGRIIQFKMTAKEMHCCITQQTLRILLTYILYSLKKPKLSNPNYCHTLLSDNMLALVKKNSKVELTIIWLVFEPGRMRYLMVDV